MLFLNEEDVKVFFFLVLLLQFFKLVLFLFCFIGSLSFLNEIFFNEDVKDFWSAGPCDISTFSTDLNLDKDSQFLEHVIFP